MSQENVEIIRRLLAAFEKEDFEAIVPYLHPDVETRPGLVGGPEMTTHRGVEGMRRFWVDIDAAWEEFRIEPAEFREVEGAVLVLGHVYARGRESGISLASPAGWLAGMRDGRLVTFQSFNSQAEALEAAGLSE
ncbi:MAG: nuclear transport factor 2 family protein [Actinomycetota bacterium]|nr:nuclear transport factor 2 family protein [Actinomycetota bacterium]